MKCAEVQTQLREYLEDLHGEPSRAQLRQHLAECSLCTGFALRLGSYTSDILRLAQAPLPFDLASAYLNDPEIPREIKRLSPKQIVIPILIASAVVFLSVYVPRVYRYVLAELEKERRAAQEEPAALKILKQIAADLGAPQNAHPVTAEVAAPPEEEKKAEPSGPRVKLKPFHWHLKFNNEPLQKRFDERLKTLKAKTLFKSNHLVVFEADRELLSEMTRWVMTTEGILPEGVVVNISTLPAFEPARISVFMDSKGQEKAVGSLHWHLHFTMPNRLTFLDWLHKKEFRFDYETSDLWVIDVKTAEEYESLREEINSTQGLIVEMGLQDPWKDRVQGKLILFIREG